VEVRSRQRPRPGHTQLHVDYREGRHTVQTSRVKRASKLMIRGPMRVEKVYAIGHGHGIPPSRPRKAGVPQPITANTSPGNNRRKLVVWSLLPFNVLLLVGDYEPFMSSRGSSNLNVQRSVISLSPSSPGGSRPS
jgi:hypothetical protein